MWARADLINKFSPDAVLIIHYDVSPPVGNQSGINPLAPKQTKAFVVGGYQNSEIGSRESKMYLARHLLNQKSWQESLNLSKKLTLKLHKNLDLALAQYADDESYPIELGIHARNLVVPRRILSTAAISYLECLFYNNPDEFLALSEEKYTLQIDGKSYPYSERLRQVAISLREGLIEWANERQ